MVNVAAARNELDPQPRWPRRGPVRDSPRIPLKTKKNPRPPRGLGESRPGDLLLRRSAAALPWSSAPAQEMAMMAICGQPAGGEGETCALRECPRKYTTNASPREEVDDRPLFVVASRSPAQCDGRTRGAKIARLLDRVCSAHDSQVSPRRGARESSVCRDRASQALTDQRLRKRRASKSAGNEWVSV